MTSKFITRLKRLEKQAGAEDKIMTFESHEVTLSKLKEILESISGKTESLPELTFGIKAST
jgi:hypothetical protein